MVGAQLLSYPRVLDNQPCLISAFYSLPHLASQDGILQKEEKKWGLCLQWEILGALSKAVKWLV